MLVVCALQYLWQLVLMKRADSCQPEKPNRLMLMMCAWATGSMESVPWLCGKCEAEDADDACRRGHPERTEPADADDACCAPSTASLRS